MKLTKVIIRISCFSEAGVVGIVQKLVHRLLATANDPRHWSRRCNPVMYVIGEYMSSDAVRIVYVSRCCLSVLCSRLPSSHLDI